MASDDKIEQAVTLALEVIRDAAPGVLTMTEVAEKVGVHTDVTTSTARNRLRAACKAGKLFELTPWSARFKVELPIPGAQQVGPFYIARQMFGRYRNETRWVITTDSTKQSPSSYGPGRTTYLVDPEQVREYVQGLIKEKAAEEEAGREALKAERGLQRREIARRFPGLQRNLRIFAKLGVVRRADDLVAVRSSAALDSPLGREVPTEERSAEVTINVWGDENVALLRAVLTAGIAAYIAEQPLMVCKNCDGRILRTLDDRDDFWWHTKTANVVCSKDTGTKAEPVKED